MKRILCVFICILLLSGCGSEKSKDVHKEPLDFGGFECVVSANMNCIEISAKAVYTQFDSLSFTFSKPEAVSGTEIFCKSGEYTLKADGITITLSGDKMPFTMICRSLEDCLGNVRGTLPEKDLDGSAVYTYQKDGHIFKLFVNPETKCFQKLSMDNADLLFFESFTLTS